jgi:hypothetical protein
MISLATQPCSPARTHDEQRPTYLRRCERGVKGILRPLNKGVEEAQEEGKEQGMCGGGVDGTLRHSRSGRTTRGGRGSTSRESEMMPDARRTHRRGRRRDIPDGRSNKMPHDRREIMRCDDEVDP